MASFQVTFVHFRGRVPILTNHSSTQHDLHSPTVIYESPRMARQKHFMAKLWLEYLILGVYCIHLCYKKKIRRHIRLVKHKGKTKFFVFSSFQVSDPLNRKCH